MDKLTDFEPPQINTQPPPHRYQEDNLTTLDIQEQTYPTTVNKGLIILIINTWTSTFLWRASMIFVFHSSKFSSKIKYVNSLQELGEIIPMEYVHIPPSIVKWVGLYQYLINESALCKP